MSDKKGKVRKANSCISIKTCYSCVAGLAKIAAAMANGGSLGGVKVLELL